MSSQLTLAASLPSVGQATSTLGNANITATYPTGANLSLSNFASTVASTFQTSVELETSIQSRFPFRVDTTQASSSASNITYNFYTPAYTGLNTYKYQISVQWSAQQPGAGGALPGTILTSAQVATMLTNIKTATNGFLNPNLYQFFNWTRAPFHQMFQLFQIKLGTGQTSISPNASDYFPNLIQAIGLPRDFETFESLMAPFRTSITTNGNISSTVLPAVTTTTAVHDVQFLHADQSNIGSCPMMRNAYNTLIHDCFASMLNLTAAGVGTPQEIALPFGFFHDLFNQSNFLPPNLNFNLIVTLRQQFIPVFTYGDIVFGVTPVIPPAVNVNSNPYIIAEQVNFFKPDLANLNTALLKSYSNIPFIEFRQIPTNLSILPAGSTNVNFTLTQVDAKPMTYVLYFTDPAQTWRTIGNTFRLGPFNPVPNLVFQNISVDYGGIKCYSSDDRVTQNQWIFKCPRAIEQVNMKNYTKFEPAGTTANMPVSFRAMGSVLTLKIDPSNVAGPSQREMPKGPVTITITMSLSEIVLQPPAAINGTNLNAYGQLVPTTQPYACVCTEYKSTQMIINNSLGVTFQPPNALLVGPNANQVIAPQTSLPTV